MQNRNEASPASEVQFGKMLEGSLELQRAGGLARQDLAGGWGGVRLPFAPKSPCA